MALSMMGDAGRGVEVSMLSPSSWCSKLAVRSLVGRRVRTRDRILGVLGFGTVQSLSR
jgi:hypothetical protein